MKEQSSLMGPADPPGRGLTSLPGARAARGLMQPDPKRLAELDLHRELRRLLWGTAFLLALVLYLQQLANE